MTPPELGTPHDPKTVDELVRLFLARVDAKTADEIAHILVEALDWPGADKIEKLLKGLEPQEPQAAS